MTESEWTFENAPGAVIGRHTSGFTVRLPNRLGQVAKVLSGGEGLSKNDRSRLINASRRAFVKLHGREVWELKRRDSEGRLARI
jgi:hypothetical protein